MNERNTKNSTGSQNAKTTNTAKNVTVNPVNSKTSNTAKNSAKNCAGGKGTK